MIQLENADQAAKLAMSYMKPGMITNHVMTAAEYHADVEAGVLYAHIWPGGVLFLRGREGYQLLSYCINDLGIMPGCRLPDNVLCEIGYKPSGVAAAEGAVRFWAAVGLKMAFERVRLTRMLGQEGPPGGAGAAIVQKDRQLVSIFGRNGYNIESVGNLTLPPPIAPIGIPLLSLADECDIDSCHRLMHECFDVITGHIPTYRELKESVAAGCILCMKDSSGAVCGLLRCVARVGSTEIRQLAIREDMRGQGLARLLLDAFIEKWGRGKCTVWVRNGYAPALNAYRSADFVADGWRSSVMVAAG